MFCKQYASVQKFGLQNKFFGKLSVDQQSDNFNACLWAVIKYNRSMKLSATYYKRFLLSYKAFTCITLNVLSQPVYRRSQYE